MDGILVHSLETISGRVGVFYIPLSQIKRIDTIVGSENVYGVVNGIQTRESFNEILSMINGGGK
jgi:hypothetical protein